MPKEAPFGLLLQVINFILIFLIIFSPLFYGSVTLAGYTLIECGIFWVVFLYFLNMVLSGNISFLKTKLLFPCILFILLIILQIIPLPFVVLNFISPKTAYFYRQFLPSRVMPYSFFSLSVGVGSTIDAFFKILCYFLIFFLIINYVESKKQFDLLFNTIIISALIISIFAIIQRFSYGSSGKVYWFDFKGSAPSCFGPFVNRNHFAGYIEMVIPLCLGYLISDIDIRKKTFYGLALFIMSLSLFLSLSRAGMAIYLFSLVLMIIILLIKKKHLEQSSIIFLAFLSIVIFLFFLTDFKVILERFFSIFETKPSPIFERGYPWSDILKMWLDLPFFGTGLGTFATIAPLYKSSNLQMVILYAHNDYLQLLAETGIFGVLFIILFFYFYFSSLFKMWLRRHDRFVTSLVLGCTVSIFAIFIHSLVDFNLRIPANALLFFIILGLNYKLVFTGFKKRHALSPEDLAENN